MKREIVLVASFIAALATATVVFGLMFGADDVAGWGTKHGDNKPSEKGCKQANTLKEYAKLVDDMKCKGEPELDEFMSDYGHTMNQAQEKCIEHRADLGNELYENEIMKCYKKHD